MYQEKEESHLKMYLLALPAELFVHKIYKNGNNNTINFNRIILPVKGRL
jgi:hypothetical protein